MEGMELVQQLLAGSKRINEMRREIDSTVGMILGFLTKAEFSRFKYHEIVCKFESFKSPGLIWTIEKSAHEISVFIADKNRPEVGYIYGSGLDISLLYVQPVYQGLPDFLANMVNIFPQLEGRLVPLLEVAMM